MELKFVLCTFYCTMSCNKQNHVRITGWMAFSWFSDHNWHWNCSSVSSNLTCWLCANDVAILGWSIFSWLPSASWWLLLLPHTYTSLFSDTTRLLALFSSGQIQVRAYSDARRQTWFEIWKQVRIWINYISIMNSGSAYKLINRLKWNNN